MRRRQARDDRLQHLGTFEAGLGRDQDGVRGVEADHVLDLLLDLVGLGGRQVDLVEDRHDLVVVVDRLVDVGERLRLDALAGVDHQERALAGGERAVDLVGEVDVAGRVDQVEDVVLAVARAVVEPHGLRLDGDAALALDIHRIRAPARPSRARSRPPVDWISRSASVDLPWSIWAMIAKLRMFSMAASWRAFKPAVSGPILSCHRPLQAGDPVITNYPVDAGAGGLAKNQPHPTGITGCPACAGHDVRGCSLGGRTAPSIRAPERQVRRRGPPYCAATRCSTAKGSSRAGLSAWATTMWPGGTGFQMRAFVVERLGDDDDVVAGLAVVERVGAVSLARSSGRHRGRGRSASAAVKRSGSRDAVGADHVGERRKHARGRADRDRVSPPAPRIARNTASESVVPTREP